jgi:hypothetical protein
LDTRLGSRAARQEKSAPPFGAIRGPLKILFKEKNMKKHMIICWLFVFAIGSMYAQARVKIAILDFRPGVGVDASLVDGISEMLISSLFDTRRFSIIERTQIHETMKEQGFQSANITTGQIAEVGKILGVEYVLIGVINFIVTERTLENTATGMARGEYNIDVRIVNVQSGEVVSTAGTGVKGSETIRSVMPALANELVRKIEIAQEGDTYKVGDFGPAGGRIIYDKGIFSNGWRYLEAAPLETEFSSEWGGYERINRNEILWKDVAGLHNEVGFGKRNTQTIVEHLNQLGETGRAAQLCASLDFDGFNDWFLPSRDELRVMFNCNFYRYVGDGQGGRDFRPIPIGLSSDTPYWSSSQYGITGNAICMYWDTGLRTGKAPKSQVYKVRAVRSF